MQIEMLKFTALALLLAGTIACGEKNEIAPVYVTDITLNSTELILMVGDTEKLVATITPDNVTDSTVTWTSSDSAIANVDDDGVVTAVTTGTVTITVTTKDGGRTAKTEIQIINPPIDFSNIENLYEQPLPVIKRAVQGKWKIYQITSDGDQWIVDYPENLYIEIKDKYHVSWESEGKRDTVYYTWKKTAIKDWRSPFDGYMTYFIWNESDFVDHWYFSKICNDTLHYGGYHAPIYYRVTKVR